MDLVLERPEGWNRSFALGLISHSVWLDGGLECFVAASFDSIFGVDSLDAKMCAILLVSEEHDEATSSALFQFGHRIPQVRS